MLESRRYMAKACAY